MKRFICALFVCTQLAACTTLSVVPYGEGAGGTGSIAPGDDLRIRFREGGERRIKVTRVNADEICAQDGCLRTSEIAGVERSQLDIQRTLLAGLLVVVGVALLAGLVSAVGKCCALAGGP